MESYAFQICLNKVEKWNEGEIIICMYLGVYMCLNIY